MHDYLAGDGFLTPRGGNEDETHQACTGVAQTYALCVQKGPRCELGLAELIEDDQRHFAIHDTTLF